MIELHNQLKISSDLGFKNLVNNLVSPRIKVNTVKFKLKQTHNKTLRYEIAVILLTAWELSWILVILIIAKKIILVVMIMMI